MQITRESMIDGEDSNFIYWETMGNFDVKELDVESCEYRVRIFYRNQTDVSLTLRASGKSRVTEGRTSQFDVLSFSEAYFGQLRDFLAADGFSTDGSLRIKVAAERLQRPWGIGYKRFVSVTGLVRNGYSLPMYFPPNIEMDLQERCF